MISSIRIKNPSSYYVPDISKSHFDLPNPDCFRSVHSKQEGYESRLYYEYLATIRNGGWCQYVTLTYNNKHIPMFYGIPCLRNSDIRSLFHDSRFFKDLQTNRGYKLKYFVGAELGEGGESHNYKGSRGVGNNPHYHVILFITPIRDWCRFDRRTGELFQQNLTPKEVADAIRHYWQGHATLKRNFKKGIVNFGKVDPNGVVRDIKAIWYTSKYCVKDESIKQSEALLLKRTYKNILKKADEHFPAETDLFLRDSYIKELQSQIIKEFRSEHSYRVLCSHGLGISIIDQIKDPMNPTVSIPTKDGNVERSVPQYIYRKLFYDIKKDSDLKYYYKLNDLGIQYKINKLSQDIENLAKSTYDHIFALTHNRDLFKLYIDSSDNNFPCPFTSVNPDTHKVSYNDSTFILLNKLVKSNSSDTLDNIFYKFALYDKVYKDRYYFDTPFGDSPLLDPIADYTYFLQSTHMDLFKYSYDPSDIALPDIHSYSCHPYFNEACKDTLHFKAYDFFDWFRDVNSFVFCQADRKDKQDYENWKKFRRMLKTLKQ